MLDRIIRFVVLGLVRLFYPRIEILGREHLPATGPAIFVANHSNGLLDPLLVTASTGRSTQFLAASYLFRYPVLGRIMRAFGALPVFRERDRDTAGGAAKDLVEQNEEVFAQCRALLRSQGALALFPEGTTHSGPKLLRLRSGAARIALSAEAEAEWQLGLQVVPVGLWYENKTLFRSRVLVVVGQPFTLSDYTAAYQAKPTQTLRTVTNEMARRLNAVVLQAENRELLDAMPVVADWTAPAGPPRTLGGRYARAGALLEAYGQLSKTDPARLEELARHARRYARTLRLLGIDDPWSLELQTPAGHGVARRAILLALTAPLAGAGFVSSYAPYRLARPVARHLAKSDDTQLGHTKLIAGSILVFLGWLLVAGFIAIRLGIRRAIVVLLVQPLLGYIALRWGELWHDVRDALRYGWLRARRRSLVQQLAERRRQLAAEIQAAAATTTGRIEVPARTEASTNTPAPAPR